MAINKVEIKNFTVFEDVMIEFSKMVNVFIGENGTGKTHLLKLLQYAQKYEFPHSPKGLFSDAKLLNISVAPLDNIVYLDILTDENIKYILSERYFTEKKRKAFLEKNYFAKIHVSETTSQIFIPAKDMLTHSRGLSSMAKKYSKEMPFDRTLLDIIDKALQWKLDETPEIAKAILPKLEKIMGGKVLVKDETFYIEKTDGREIEFSVEAEGIKKIGLLWQLLMNESITKDTVLLWDEPESNINPKLIPDIVEILLELSRQGVQVFAATHNYMFAKYIEVLSAEGDDLKFHSLYRANNGVLCESSDKFTTLENNTIIAESIRLYKAEIKKVMG